jgi:hypothetical protein
MNTGSIEEQIKYFLLRRDYRTLVYLSEEDKRVWRLLQSNLYQADENLQWHAIEAIAIFMRKWWDSGHQERVLDYMRRLIWSINDESGGIGWSTPQTIAEIVVTIPQLGEPFVNIMINRAFKEPALIKSGLWAVGRLGQRIRQSVEQFQGLILTSFTTDDTETLGLASWAMGEARLESALPYLKVLKNRKESIRIYVASHFTEKPLGSWARVAITKIGRLVSEGQCIINKMPKDKGNTP